MSPRPTAATLSLLTAGLLFTAASAAPLAGSAGPVPTLDSARVTINGTSNVHAYTASTTDVRMTRIALADGVALTGPADLLKPGAIEAFEIAVAAGSLSSPKEGLDKNMHKALKVKDHPQIVFRLVRLEPGVGGAARAVGLLTIAGVEREIAMDVKAEVKGSTLTVRGEVPLLMTDFGITPPKAMLGMLKTDPRVTVSFETILSVPLT